MATNLFEALDNFVSCLHCNKTYQAPKRLPCSHIYCKECLVQIIGESNNPGEFNCPACQMEVSISSVDDVPDVSALETFIQALDTIKSLGLNQLSKCSLCKAANLTTDAELFCLECVNSLCQVCVPRHKLLQKTHNNLVPCTNLEPHHLERIMKNRTSDCSEHFQVIEYFCSTCDILLCSKCAIFDHGGHTIQSLDTAGDTIRTRLSDYVQKLHKREDEYDKYSVKADDSKTEYIKQAQTTKNQLAEHGEKLIQKIKQFLEQSNETIDTETTKICTQIDQLKETLRIEKSRLSNLATYISTIVIYGNQDDVTNVSHDKKFYDAFLNDHQPTHDIPSLDVDLQLVDLEQIQQNYFGILHYRIKPGNLSSTLVTKFSIEFDPADVACMGNGNVVACQLGGSVAAVFAADGSKLHTLQVPSGTSAYGIASTSKHIYIINKKQGAVLMFNYKGKYIKTIPVGSKGDSAIAITENQMYVTSQDDHKVYKLNLPDGATKTVFLQNKDGIDRPYGVAASSTRVAVASDGIHSVQVFNTAGKLQFKYGMCGQAGSDAGQLNGPRVLALDSIGRVIVADYYNYRIVILSSKGEHLGNIMLARDSLRSPECVCINKDGNIVAGCYNPNTIAVYKYSFQ